jgi:glycosyltransferase involved in cell wall biosynthesis
LAQVGDQLQAEVAAIRQSGLFLSTWYLQRRPLVPAGEDGVEDFCLSGWREGVPPNPYFNPVYYLEQNPDVLAAGFNPLWHYIFFGEFEGRDPCAFFDCAWYRKTYGIGPREHGLRHFLERRFTGQVNPVPVFDAAFYLEANPDVAAGGADPFEHFLIFGTAEGRDPAPDFDVKFYTKRYGAVLEGQNPLLHYLANRDGGGFFPSRPLHEGLIPAAVKRATRASAYFEEFRPLPPGAEPAAKLLAYYLPQFHQVAENDAWWGKGFTDWTNLGRALPRYAGHLQPRVPRDLGFYSLDDSSVLPRQIEMAKGAGLSGFVFYYYWFNGHRLLEKPLEQLLADQALDFPFCVMWANENWTRRWDGLEREVLIAQEYRERDDAALVASFARLFADARYIRVQARPLLMIYRIDLVPDAAKRLARWRELFRANHDEDPVIIMAQSLGDYDPTPYGLDGAVEFPPHKLSQACQPINDSLDLFDPDFGAAVFDYEDIAAVSLEMPPPDYPLIKTITPGWDNDPRREGKGLVLHDPTPAKYQTWLENLVRHTETNRFFGERIICVNAWNEWAEGAVLEPDIHFGGAFLNATGRALCPRGAADAHAGILLVGHDAQPHGSQMLLLNLARHFSRQWGIKVYLLLLGVGPLIGRYYETADVTVAYDKAIIGRHLDGFRQLGIRHAIVNSTASARVIPQLAARDIEATLLVHEMPRLLKEFNLEVQAKRGGAAASRVVFAADYVRRRFCETVELNGIDARILPQGNYLSVGFDAAARRAVRRDLGISDDAFIILGAGFADFRKGFDLFIQMARNLAASDGAKIHFVWVGEINFTLKTYLGPEIDKTIATGRLHLVGFTDSVAKYFAAADVYALTSREDPYPTVVLEALACGVPTVAFDETGGIPDLLRHAKAGLVAPLGDAKTFETHLLSLLDHKKLNADRARLIKLAAEFAFPPYAEKLLRIAMPELRGISVCVLNYNYARHLPTRLGSVFAQTYPVAEILFFDDASTDNSLATATQIAHDAKRDINIIPNAKNAGAVFSQWRRAAQAAQGEFIWIAEADDDCAPEFLATLMDALARAPGAILAFADSRAVDDNGATISPSYLSYYLESGAQGLAASGLWEARDFATKFLSERNLILNASAVLWRRAALLAALDACGETLDGWKLAGDWRLYLEALTCQPGSVTYVAAPLNIHRRHQASVTHNLDAGIHAAEIAEMHRLAAEKLKLDEQKRAKQGRYLDQIKAQFGLAGAPKPKKRANTGIVARQRKL